MWYVGELVLNSQLTYVIYRWAELEAHKAIRIIIFFYLYHYGGEVSYDSRVVSIGQQG